MAAGVVAGAGLAWLTLLAGCQLVLDFSPIADAGSPGDSAGEGGGADAADLCIRFEPNDQLDQAVEVAPGTFQASICGTGDSDYYRFTLDGSQDLVIDLTFDPGADDLELELYNVETTELLVVSNHGDGDEGIVRSADQASRLATGTYAARVFGRDAKVQNDYVVNWIRGAQAASGPEP